MNFNFEQKVGALFKLIVRKCDTNEISEETGFFQNLVLDTGLTRMVSGMWIDRCCVGTGNSVPEAGQTALDNFLASTTSVAAGVSDTGGIQIAEEPYYFFGQRTWRFPVGSATGNVSEIGMGWSNSNLWNRALIKDVNGNPTTITVLADEYLDVVSQVRIYPSSASGSFNVVDKLGAIVSTHTYSATPYFNNISSQLRWNSNTFNFSSLNNDGFWISSENMPIGLQSLPSTKLLKINANPQTANGTSKKAEIKVTNLQAIGSHRSFVVVMNLMSNTDWAERSCGYKWQVDPPIQKTNEIILTYSFTLTFGRYT